MLDGHLDVGLAREIWETALEARWDGKDRWFHGDVAQGNLLLDGGRLVAVIDFGTCGVGDPSCDLAAPWTLLTADIRPAFRERLPVDEGTWARGRGWALRKPASMPAANPPLGTPTASDEAITGLPRGLEPPGATPSCHRNRTRPAGNLPAKSTVGAGPGDHS